MLQLTGCPPQASSSYHPQLFALCLIHGSRYCPPRYVVTVITIAICLVQPSLYLYLWSFIMMSHESCYSAAVISVSQVILSLILSLFIFVVLYIYVTNRSIEASQEFGP